MTRLSDQPDGVVSDAEATSNGLWRPDEAVRHVRFLAELVTPSTVADGCSWGHAHHQLKIATGWDIETLLDIHTEMTGSRPGRRPREGVQVLSRSAVVLTCAYWEAFCEDLAGEALEHLATHAAADELPKGLKTSIVKILNSNQHEHASWTLAGEGWRTVLRDRAATLRSDDHRGFNTPKSRKVSELFQELGLDDVTQSWRWHRNSPGRVCDRLDTFVTLRGTIAHRGDPTVGVRKTEAKDGLDLVRRLAAITAETVWRFVYDYSGAEFPSFAPNAPIPTRGDIVAPRSSGHGS